MTKIYNLLKKHPNDFRLVVLPTDVFVIGQGNFVVLEITEIFGDLKKDISALSVASKWLVSPLKEPHPINTNRSAIYKAGGRFSDNFIIHPLDEDDYNAVMSDTTFKRNQIPQNAVIVEDKSSLLNPVSDGYFTHFIYRGVDYAVTDSAFASMK